MRSALKRGNSFVTAGQWGPILLVNSNGDEPGDEVRIRPGDELPLRIRIMSNRPLKGYPDGIRIIVGGQVVQTLATDEGAMTMNVNTRVRIDSPTDTWLVVQAFGAYPAAAMTNAIYIVTEPHADWGSKQWVFPPGAEDWNNPWPNVPEITVPDGPAVPDGVRPKGDHSDDGGL